MEDCLLNRISFRGIAATLVALLATTTATTRLSAQACPDPAKTGAAWLELIERQGVTPTVYQLFSDGLRQRATQPQLRTQLGNALASFGIDGRDKPLSERTLRGPYLQALDPGKPSYLVWLVAESARGEIREDIVLTCDNGRWKILRVEYKRP
jgi:hypothetical protein